MSRHPLSLPMSQIIASDAPLLSPVDSHWEHLYSPTSDSFPTNLNYNYYLPPSPPHSVGSTSTDSPVPATRMLKKMRMSPSEASESEQQLCLPTHQVFDFPEVARPPTPPSAPSSPKQQRLSISIKPPALCSAEKRSASPTPSVTKKTRTVGERISTKDFIPPDVSGLSKREARLVKNRAAAFLSRQRKREEFETMEVHVAELERENARLLALTQNGNSGSSRPIAQSGQPDNHTLSEVEQLRAQLAAAQARERELAAELCSKAIVRDAPVKIEAVEPSFPLSSPPRSTSIQSPHKSAASLGLMVLLCALPSLLSMPTQSALPTSFSVPTAMPPTSPAFDFASLMQGDYDWSRGNAIMNLEHDDQSMSTHTTPTSTSTTTRKLEFSSVDSSALGELGGLDISFDASPSEDGKIRVRIHPSSSASSRAGSPGASSAYSGSNSFNSKLESMDTSTDLWGLSPETKPNLAFLSESHYGNAPSSSLAAGVPSSSAASYSPSNSVNGDPFLGVGSSSHEFGYSAFSSGPLGSPYGQNAELDYGSQSEFGFGSEYSVGDNSCAGKRRVRIALKSMPAAGGEGGEWEVQFC